MNMRVVGLDIETTGLKQPEGDRIIEIALRSYDKDSRSLVDSYVQRIDPQRNISNEAMEIHGISYSDVSGCPIWEDIADDVLAHLNQADLIVIHNADFDAPFVGGELLRIGKSLPSHLQVICTMENGRWATPNGKYPNLGELCFALGVHYDPSKAHGAEYDVDVMMECFFRGLERGFYQLPEGIRGPHNG